MRGHSVVPRFALARYFAGCNFVRVALDQPAKHVDPCRLRESRQSLNRNLFINVSRHIDVISHQTGKRKKGKGASTEAPSGEST
jgi:hypothetical protein